MPRKPRIDYEGAYHHVMNRGQNQQTVFHDTKDFEAFLKILELRGQAVKSGNDEE